MKTNRNMPAIYPEMTFKSSLNSSGHGVPAPTLVGKRGYTQQVQDTLDLAFFNAKNAAWNSDLWSILWKYFPLKGLREVLDFTGLGYLLADMGFENWRSVCDFVRDDKCIEFYTILDTYCSSRYAVKEVKDGFDNSGVGDYKNYLVCLDKTLDRAFEAKYFFFKAYSTMRPLEYLYGLHGVDYSGLVDYVHPGHPRYIAGHDAKFSEAVQAIFRKYEIKGISQVGLLFAKHVLSMGRSGLLVHLPEDNVNGMYGNISGLKWAQFQEFK